MSLHINFIQRKSFRERVWKTLNVVVGITTILNVSMIGALVSPQVANAGNNPPNPGNPSADLDQCANFDNAGPSASDCDPTNWVNGNLGSSKARYYEGDSVPYRMRFDNLTIGSHTVIVEWDTTKSDKHALDYITSYDRTVTTANPCAGVSGCGASTTFPIPVDPQVSGASVTQIAGNFTLFGGTITSLSAYSAGAGFPTGDNSRRIAVTFTASVANPVLAWGGHIAHRQDWGATNSAIAIPGSPYHTRLISLDGTGGNQDRSLSADAVIFPGSIKVVKQATPEGSTSFPFTASPAPLSNFNLVDDGTSANTKIFSNITDFKTYTVAENTGSWTLSGAVCGVTTPNGGSQDVNGATATINLKEGENVTCTYTNTVPVNGSIAGQKFEDMDGDGTKDAGDNGLAGWTIRLLNTSNVELATTTTDANGNYTFNNLTPNATYRLREVQQTNWTQTTANPADVLVGDNQNVTGINFGNFQRGKIDGYKFNDLNGDGSWDQGEPALADWKINVDVPGTDTDQEFITNAQGFYAFWTTVPGDYTIWETNQAGWTQTAPNPHTAVVTATSGMHKVLNFGNHRDSGLITFDKVIVGGGPAVDADFTFAVDGNGAYTDGQSVSLDTNTTHAVTESSAYSSLYTLTDASGVCSLNQGQIVLQVGTQGGTCVVENTRNVGAITVNKMVNESNGQGFVSAVGAATPFRWQLDGGSDRFMGSTAGSLPTGSDYDVTENDVPGYHFVGWFYTNLAQDGNIYRTCDNPAYTTWPKNLTVTTNATTQITLCNVRDTGRLIVNKNVDTDGDGQVDIVGATDWTWDILNGEQNIATGDGRTLTTGAFTISEDQKTDYHVTDLTCNGQSYGAVESAQVTVDGQGVACTFTNTRDTGGLTVIKAIDTDGNGTVDSWNTGWTWDRDGGNQSYAMGTTQTVLTGQHSVTEDQQADYHNLNWSCVDSQNQTPLGNGTGESLSVNVSTHGATCTFTNVRNTGTVEGYKFNDLNGNGAWDQPAEPGLEGWTIQLSNGSSTLTDANGHYQFNLVPTGTYTVNEVQQPDWTNTTPLSVANVVVAYNQSAFVNFGNFNLFDVTVCKKVDLNSDGDVANDPFYTNGWNMTLNRATQATNEDGCTTFTDLGPGAYAVTEDLTKQGWVQTVPGNNGGFNFNAVSGQNQTFVFGNFETPTLTVIKHVINDNGGSATADLFTMNVNGTNVSTPSFSGVETPGTTVTLGAGSYDVTESGGPSGYTQTNLDPNCTGSVQSGDHKTCTITNDDQPIYLNAWKIVCTNEADLPNWGKDGGPNITATTAQDWVNSHESCSLQKDWSFQYAADLPWPGNPGDNTGAAGAPWTTFGPTDNNGFTTTTINQYGGVQLLWVREVWQNGYIPFTMGPNYDNSNDVSAEMYCHTDVINYDNFEWINNLQSGQTYNCVAWNVENKGTVTVTKMLDNTGDGKFEATNPQGWTWQLDDTTGLAMGDTEQTVMGPHTVKEAGPSDGYHFVGWFYTNSESSCEDRELNTSYPIDINVALGQDTAITLCNARDTGTLTLVKNLIKDNGGTAVATDWTLAANGATPISGVTGSSAVTNATVIAGTYTLSENNGPTGYTASDYSCVVNNNAPVQGNSVTLANGDHATCTIINDDQVPSLTLIKHVVKDNGGDAQETDWVLSANGTTPLSGTTPVTSDASFNAGTYTLSETGPAGYSASAWSCEGGSLNGTEVTVGLGETVTCEITNDDIAPTITLIKNVINNNGGTAGVNDFGLTIGGTSVTSGQTLPVLANTPIALNEAGKTGYAFVSMTDLQSEDREPICPSVLGGTVTLVPGQNITCVITNDDIQPKLTVTKVVINDNGGTKVISDFPLFVDQTSVTSGVQNGFNVGSYTVSETNLPGYASSISGDCAANGSITLGLGDTKSCTITNNDIIPILGITKANDVIGFTNPGKQVTYTITVTNAASATDIAKNVVLNDALPAGFTFADSGLATKSTAVGDIGIGVTKVFTFLVNISAAQTAGIYTNTATAQGSNTLLVTATSNVDVRVPSVLGVTLEPTLVLTKTVNATVTNPGKTIIYTVTISNPGDADVTNVRLSDKLPKGFVFADTGKDTKTWDIGTLKAHHQRVINYPVKLADNVKAGKYDNLATVLSNELDPQTAKATVEVKVPQVLGLATTGVSARDYLLFSFGFGLMTLGFYWVARLRRQANGLDLA